MTSSLRRRIAPLLDDPAEREQQLQAAVAREVEHQLAARARVDADLQFSITTLLAGRGSADRRLNEARYATLNTQICALTGTPDARWRLAQAYLSILDVESRGLGRIAGSTYNILGKLVVPPLLGAPAGPILEIGTLYGLFSPALVRSFRRVGEFRALTVVDPFAGGQVQGKGGVSTWDDPSGTPVVEDVVRRNMVEFGLAEPDFRLVAGFSTDESVRAAAGDRAYSVVVIDGDHYEEGVAADLRWVETILAPGGIAVMDDFGDKRWPGVEAAVRGYLADGGRMELLGTASTSGYLRLPAEH